MSQAYGSLVSSGGRSAARQLRALVFALCGGLALLVGVLAWSGPARGEVVAPGFAETEFAGGLSRPTAMAFAPDGRLFVAQQTGELRVVTPGGELLEKPFLALDPATRDERGLLGIAFHPNFEANGHVYVYYTARRPIVHNRVARFTADPQDPNVVERGSFKNVLDLGALKGDDHNGGAMHFGRDGKLYVAVGDNQNGANAQTLGNLKGKMLRINADGSMPEGNPFYRKAGGKNRAIWALGLRNPYTFAINQNTGSVFINDVGAKLWEEVNRGDAGANYGWPKYEGRENAPRYRSPVFAYSHDNSANVTGCAITGGAFYAPDLNTFGSDYENDYFFGDFCEGWIRKRDPQTGSVALFAQTEPYGLVDIQVSEQGDLYYLHRATSSVRKISKN